MGDVRPQTDAEILDASVYAAGESNVIYCAYVTYITSNLGHGSETKFDLKVRHKERLLRKVMVAYLGAASDFTGKHRPVRPATMTLTCEIRTRNYTRALTDHLDTSTRRPILSLRRYVLL